MGDEKRTYNPTSDPKLPGVNPRERNPDNRPKDPDPPKPKS